MSVRGLVDGRNRPLDRDATVLEACKTMHDTASGAVAIAEDGNVCGIFTYRDLIERVLLGNRNPKDTRLSEVMSRDVETLTVGARYGDALRRMVAMDYTYMPVIDKQGHVCGMVSLRSLLEHRIDALGKELDSVTQYLAVDGPGGD
jgi:CBS domain-containing protein